MSQKLTRNFKIMITKIILFFTIILYSIVVSQSFMYILALEDVQLKVGAGTYVELRKLIDFNMRNHFKFVVYGALLFSLAYAISCAKHWNSVEFITASIAFVALLADSLLTLKGSLPINDVINSWTPENYPSNWIDYRRRWFEIFRYRQILNLTGFVSLVVGILLRKPA